MKESKTRNTRDRQYSESIWDKGSEDTYICCGLPEKLWEKMGMARPEQQHWEAGSNLGCVWDGCSQGFAEDGACGKCQR